MVIIFIFSHQKGSDSSLLSGNVRNLLVDAMLRLGFNIDTYISHNLIRAAAHFINFFVLYLLWYFSFIYNGIGEKKSLAVSLIICVLYALFDEAHQYFIPGRGSSLLDVIIDSAGSLSSMGICSFFQRKRRIKRAKNNKKDDY